MEVRKMQVQVMPTHPSALPTPMAVVREYTSSSEDARHVTIYFRKGVVEGGTFNTNRPEIFARLKEVSEALDELMLGEDYFVSMIPEHYLHFKGDMRTLVPKTQPVPYFPQSFAVIGEILQNAGIKNQCDVEITINTGREYCGSPKPPKVELSIIERPKMKSSVNNSSVVNHKALGINLDARSDAAEEIMSWYAGAAYGLICWKWTPKLEVQRRSFVHEIEK